MEAHGGVLYAAGRVTMLHVYERPSVAPTQSTVITFLVPDLEPVMAGLRARGIEFEEYDMLGLKTHDGVQRAERVQGLVVQRPRRKHPQASSSMAICGVWSPDQRCHDVAADLARASNAAEGAPEVQAAHR